MIFVAVGTFVRGFDALVEAVDLAVERLDLEGTAQIGHGSYLPRRLGWHRFLSDRDLRARIEVADLVVAHAGMGLLGDAMRAGKPIVVVPRKGPTTSRHPANDQTAFARRIAERFPIALCDDPQGVEEHLARWSAGERPAPRYDLAHDVGDIVAAFLRGTARR